MAAALWAEQGEDKSQIYRTPQGVNKVNIVIIIENQHWAPLLCKAWDKEKGVGKGGSRLFAHKGL